MGTVPRGVWAYGRRIRPPVLPSEGRAAGALAVVCSRSGGVSAPLPSLWKGVASSLAERFADFRLRPAAPDSGPSFFRSSGLHPSLDLERTKHLGKLVSFLCTPPGVPYILSRVFRPQSVDAALHRFGGDGLEDPPGTRCMFARNVLPLFVRQERFHCGMVLGDSLWNGNRPCFHMVVEVPGGHDCFWSVLVAGRAFGSLAPEALGRLVESA